VYGYLEKPLDPEELVITIERIIGPPDNPEVLSSVRSSKMKKVLRDLKNLSEDDLPVIISGDEGVDRGYYARILHFQGKRRGNLFFSPDLNRRGPEWLKLLKDSPEDIRGGSLFIDRINSLDTWVWKDLEDITRITDVRLMGGIEGTLDNVNEPLRQSIIRLFGEREIRIPPVKERKDDILLIMDYLIDKMERRFRQGKKRLSKEARSYALKYHWPGNDRELEETIMKAYIFSKGEVIDKKDLFAGDMSLFPLEEFLSLRLKGLIKENSNLYHAVIGEVEKALIGIVLHEVEGNQLKASRILGINRNTLRSKIKDLNLNGRI
jgi:DNA-binding NtrC family response regulator